MANGFENWLSRLDEEQLARILGTRAEVLTAPWPRRIAELAAALVDRGAVIETVARLAMPATEIAQALAVADCDGTGVALTRLAELVGTEVAAIEPVVAMLIDHALVWTDKSGQVVHLVGPMGDIWHAPLGLGEPIRDFLEQATMEPLKGLARTVGVVAGGRKQHLVDALVAMYRDPDRMATLLATAPAKARELVHDFAWHGPAREVPGQIFYGYPNSKNDDPHRWLAERGLIWRTQWNLAVMPREVGLAARGREYRLPFTPDPPAVVTTVVAPAAVEHEAAAAATRTVDRVAAMVDAAANTPVALLKTGGVGVREVRRLAKETSCTEAETRLQVALALAAGLLGGSGDGGGLTATELFDTWRTTEPAVRLRILLGAWWRLPSCPLLRQEDSYEPLIAKGDGSGAGSRYPLVRHAVLRALAELSEDAAARDDVVDLMRWRLPLVHPDMVAICVPATMAEASLLGVVAQRAVSGLGRALAALAGDATSTTAESDPGLAERARDLLSAARQSALFGADLTAIVTGPPSIDLAELLDRAADREAQATASVWRFSPASVRRAFDAAETADGLLAALTAVAQQGELPQPLVYLVRDVARRHGEVGVIDVACVVCGQDPALLAEIAVHRTLAALTLRTVAPTVLASAVPAEQTLAALRAAGYAPVARDADGSIVVHRNTRPRAPAPRPRDRATVALLTGDSIIDTPQPSTSEPSTSDLRDATADPREHAHRLLTVATQGPKQPAQGRLAQTLPRHTTGLNHGQGYSLGIHLEYTGSAQITYTEDDGRSLRYRIRNAELAGSTLDAWCDETHGYRRFHLDRITATAV